MSDHYLCHRHGQYQPATIGGDCPACQLDPTPIPVFHAYPTAGHPEYQTSDGMTMRQHYKAQALSGGLLAQVVEDDWAESEEIERIIASRAGVIADAMIAEDQRHDAKARKT